MTHLRYEFDKIKSDYDPSDWSAYRKGVDRVLEYIESTYSYPKLYAELKWAIEEGII